MSKGQPKPLGPDGRGLSVALCATRWNAHVVDRLLAGAEAALRAAGASVSVYRCAGAFELPALCARVMRKGQDDGVVALGCLIRGETDHYRVLADEATRALGMLSLEGGTNPRPIAVTFGVLTCENEAQAEARAGKGEELAHTCLEQVRVLREAGQ